MKLEQAAREVVRQHSMECLSDKAVDALREALSEQAEQEPVLCVECGQPVMHIGNKCYACCQKATKELEDALKASAPVKQAEQEPVKRKWVEPSDELLNDILMRYAKTELYRDDFGAFRAVLKLAKELNT